MQKKLSPKGIFNVLKSSVDEFLEHKATRMSAALAYYTVFSMGPLLLLIISLAAAFFGREAIEGEVYTQLDEFLGAEAAKQIQAVIRNAAVEGASKVGGIIGGITLLFGATGVFGEIQGSINDMWEVKAKPKRGWVKLIQNRMLSFSVIMSLVFVLLVSLSITTFIDTFSNRLSEMFPGVALVVIYIINQSLTLLVVTAIFAVIFKVLPDAEIRWRDVIWGAVTTAILFMIGKFAISFYIGRSDLGSTYGAAASIVVVLLWTYYSTMILYFGAAFTKVYAVSYGMEIRPMDYAVRVEQVEVEDKDINSGGSLGRRE